MRFEIKILKNDFPQAPALMRRAVGAGFAAAKGDLLGDAQNRTPVDTGFLRASESAESDETALTLRATAPYAVHVHQGARGRQGRPFLRDAVESGLPGVVDAIVAAANRELS